MLLQPVVADLIGLGLYGKNAHWNVSGPGFRAVHVGLDDLVGVAQAAADTLSEWMKVWDSRSTARPAMVGRRAVETRGRRQQPRTEIAYAVRWMVDLVDAVSAGIRGSIETVATFDGPTGDILSQIVLDLEQQRWLLGSAL